VNSTVLAGEFIKCPKCNATLPPTNRACQFCGTDVSHLTRGYVAQPEYKPYGGGLPKKWVFGLYYAISAYYVYQGLFSVVRGLGVFGKVSEMFSAIYLVFGGITALIGLGLLLRVELIRGIVNIFCGIQIAFGFLGLITGVMAASVFGWVGFLIVVNSVIQIATSGFMIYLIGETDTQGPNF